MGGLIITPYQPGDALLAGDFAVEAWRGIFDGYQKQLGDELFGVFFGNWKAEKRAEFGRSLSDNAINRRAFTLCADGKIAAMGSYRAGRNAAVVCSNAVAPEFRGRGYGSMLYRHMLAAMKAEANPPIAGATVTTGGDDAHAPARRAYERSGFGLPVPHITYYRKNTPPQAFSAPGGARLTELGAKPPQSGAKPSQPGKTPPEPLAVLPDGSVITLPEPGEYAEIANLAVKGWEIVWDSHRRLLGDENFEFFHPACRERKYADTLSALENNFGREFVLRTEGKIAGFCGYSAAFPHGAAPANPAYYHATVGLNAVLPEFRGRGYGSVMQDFITARMFCEGIAYAKVSTGGDEGHAAARRAYESAGFAASLESVTLHIRF